jgi:imidazole glycerol phosphate synthase subunit HisF
MQGYDLDLVQKVADAVNVPVVASGGAGNLQHIADVIKTGMPPLLRPEVYLFFKVRCAQC